MGIPMLRVVELIESWRTADGRVARLRGSNDKHTIAVAVEVWTQLDSRSAGRSRSRSGFPGIASESWSFATGGAGFSA
jgi:hypothetical protein